MSLVKQSIAYVHEQYIIEIRQKPRIFIRDGSIVNTTVQQKLEIALLNMSYLESVLVSGFKSIRTRVEGL